MVIQGTSALYRPKGVPKRTSASGGFARISGVLPRAAEPRQSELQFTLSRAHHLARVVLAATLRKVNLSFDRLQGPPHGDLRVFEPLQCRFSRKIAHGGSVPSYRKMTHRPLRQSSHTGSSEARSASKWARCSARMKPEASEATVLAWIRREPVREPRGRQGRRASAARTPQACRAEASALSQPARP